MADDVVKFYGIKDTLLALQKVEPEIYKELIKDIKKLSQPVVTEITRITPEVLGVKAPKGQGLADGKKGHGLYNFHDHNGRTRFNGVRVSVSVTPRQRSKKLGSTTANLVVIKAGGKGGTVGFNIADMAGRAGSRGKTPQGRKMIEVLNRRNGLASRFAYKGAEKQIDSVRAATADTIRNLTTRLTREFNK